MKHSAYPAYKPSGVAWLGDVPKHWNVKALKRTFITLNGATPKSGNPDYWDGDIPWATPDDLGSLKGSMLTTTRRMITAEGYASCGVSLVPEGSLVLSTRAPIGHLAVAGIALCTNQGCRSLVFRSDDNRCFFFYQLFAARPELQSLGQGSTFTELNRDRLTSAYLVSPPLDEQRAIAVFLDRETARIDALIEKKQRQIELLREKRSALISHAVTKGLDSNAKMKDSGIEWLGEIPEHWEINSIRRIAKAVKTGGTPSGAEEIHFAENGFNWHTPSDFHDDLILAESSRKLSELGKKEVRVFPAMTVMMVGIGATIGKVALSPEPSSCNQQINAIVCNSKMTPEFLTYFLRIMREYIHRCGKFTTLPIINQEDTKALIITYPPLPEQDEIVSILDKETERTDALIAKIQMSIDKLLEYRTALISAVVTGKIDVRTVPAGRQEEVS